MKLFGNKGNVEDKEQSQLRRVSIILTYFGPDDDAEIVANFLTEVKKKYEIGEIKNIFGTLNIPARRLPDAMLPIPKPAKTFDQWYEDFVLERVEPMPKGSKHTRVELMKKHRLGYKFIAQKAWEARVEA